LGGEKGAPPMVPFVPASLDGIRTRFVRDRLAETEFAARGSMGPLIHWESIAAHGGPTGWASHMFYGQFRQAHPVECRCIVGELQTGAHTNPEAYGALLAEHAATERREEEARAREHAAGLAAEREAWRRAGGRP